MVIETSWRVESSDKDTKLLLRGQWDLNTIDLFLGYINDTAIWETDKNVELDAEPQLQENPLIIGVLLNLSQKVKKFGHKFTILNPTPSLKNTLKETGRLEDFSINF